VHSSERKIENLEDELCILREDRDPSEIHYHLSAIVEEKQSSLAEFRNPPTVVQGLQKKGFQIANDCPWRFDEICAAYDTLSKLIDTIEQVKSEFSGKLL
jgi:hypothetical protein